MGADELLGLLMTASASDDRPAMLSLCRAHADLIETSVGQWSSFARGTPTGVMEARARMLTAVDEIFPTHLGRQRPWAAAARAGSPFREWIAETGRIDGLMAADRYEEAGAAAGALAETIRNTKGGNLEDDLAKAVGRVGVAMFDAGRVADALGPLEAAFRLCLEAHDLDGLRAYSLNMFDAARYLADVPLADKWLGFLCEVLRRLGDPALAWYERQAPIVAAGEPLVRVVAEIGGRRYELEQVAEAMRGQGTASLRVGIEYRRNRPALGRSTHRAAEGRRLAEAGRVDEAIASFEAASRADPHDPDPVYNEGVALLDARRFGDAVAALDRVEALAPGWFLTCRYRWLGERLAAGALHPDLAGLLIRVAEPGDSERDQSLLRVALARWPDLGWLHAVDGHARLAGGNRRDAEAALRRALALELPEDVRAWAELDLARVVADPAERRTLLGHAAGSRADLRPAAYARIQLDLGQK